MSDTAPGPGTTSSRVRLPIDDVIDRVYESILRFGDAEGGKADIEAIDILAEQTPYVVAGVLRKHRAQRDGAA